MRFADELLTGDGTWKTGMRVVLFRGAMVSLLAFAAFLTARLVVRAGSTLETVLTVGAILSCALPATALGVSLSSKVLLTHVYAVLCGRPRDRLPHSFHWSARKPPFRRRPPGLEQYTPGEGGLVVPA